MERSLQEFVWQRAGHRCEYCQIPQEGDRLPFEIDHIIAENHEGPTKANNRCLCCFACNSFKGSDISGLDGLSGKLKPLFDPRRQKWSRHF
jgi:HNH endonuclease